MRMLRAFVCVMAFASVGVVSLASEGAANNTIVDTEYGPVEGQLLWGVRVFRGFPYAAPPTGQRRWNDPQPATKWQVPFQAFSDDIGCMQNCDNMPPLTCPPKQSEDCLFMNVYTPADATPASKLPVMFWIHGGSFMEGWGGGNLYNGTALVQTNNVIVVSINYRLDLFGFLYAEGLTSANFGLHDQRFALEFVQRNIANFGGDPNQVTIFGQSAGGISVAMHMVAPLSKGLFVRAIIESNPFALPLRQKQDALAFGSTVMGFAKCTGIEHPDPVACMRNRTTQELLDASNAGILDILADIKHLDEMFVPYAPYYGPDPTDEFHEQPMKSFQNGRLSSSVPLVIGTTRDEATWFIYEVFTNPMHNALYDIITDAVFAQSSYNIQQAYGLVPGPTDFRNLSSWIFTDVLFHCTARNVSRTSSATLPSVYLYTFDHILSFAKEAWGPKMKFCWDRVCHAAEVPFVWYPYPGYWNVTGLTEVEIILSAQLRTYFGNFAKTGDPNKGTVSPSASNPFRSSDVPLPNWPTYTSASEQMMLFQTPPQGNTAVTTSGSRTWSKHCDFWDQTGYWFQI